MKCIVVDDEPIALEGMVDYVKQTPFLDLVGQCRNAMEAINLLSELEIDLIFLDINMPKISGIEMVNILQKPPMIIFTTAYPDYALKGFELNAVDYILKPISYSKFLKASQKAQERLKTAQNQAAIEDQDFLYIKVAKKLVKVKPSEIQFIESLKDYIRIHTEAKSLVTYLSLNKFLEALPEKDFIQVHKSFIVSKEAIEVIEGNMIQIGEHKIPIGRAFKAALFEKVIDQKYLRK